MNLDQLFNSEEIALPRGGFDGTNQTFNDFLRALFDHYISAAGSLDDPDFPAICAEVKQALVGLERLCFSIVEATAEYLKGHPSSTYTIIEHELHGNRSALFHLEWIPGEQNRIQ